MLASTDPGQPGIGLYVHLPWCVKKCPYCDFNSYESRGELTESRYIDALLADLAVEVARFENPLVSTIFIGGGTPSLFSASAIERLLTQARKLARCAEDLEVTLEANPGAADAARFHAYRDAGVNRLSIGVQSFDDSKLCALGRVHDAAAAYAAVAAAASAGIDNLNIDLMFGLPREKSGDSITDLDAAIALAPMHISWYQLTLEQGTAFARRPPPLPGHDQVCDDQERGLRVLAAAGYQRYEISAYCRAGAAARHNLNYWRFGDYIGIGAGAHGKRSLDAGIVRIAKRRQPEGYMQGLERARFTAQETVVEGGALIAEFMLNALRLCDGVALSEFEARTGLDRAAIDAPLAQAREHGWLHHIPDHIQATEAGLRFLNDLQLLFVGDRCAARP